MSISKRQLSFLTLASALVLAGCGVQSQSAGGGAGDPSAGGTVDNGSGCMVNPGNTDDNPVTGEVTGEITFQTTNLKSSFEPFFNDLIDRFEAENPGTTVTWVDDPGDADFGPRLLNQARSCSLPDVVNVTGGVSISLNEAGQLIDFETKNPEVGAPFVQSIWDSIAMTENAVHPTLPWYWSPPVQTFNIDLFEAAGLDPENPPATYDELWEAGIQIGQNSGGAFSAFIGNPAWSLTADWQRLGVDLMNDDFTEFTFANDEEALKYVQGLADVKAAGGITSDSIAGDPDPTAGYSDGSLAFGSGSPSFLRFLTQNAPQIYERTGVSAAPAGPDNITSFGGQYIAIPNTTENLPTAMAFAEFLTNDANQLAWAQDPGVVIFPSTEQALNDPFFAAGTDSTDPMERARAIAAEEARNGVYDSSYNYLASAMEANLVREVQLAVDGQKSPADALQAAQDEANRILEEGN